VTRRGPQQTLAPIRRRSHAARHVDLRWSHSPAGSGRCRRGVDLLSHHARPETHAGRSPRSASAAGRAGGPMGPGVRSSGDFDGGVVELANRRWGVERCQINFVPSLSSRPVVRFTLLERRSLQCTGKICSGDLGATEGTTASHEMGRGVVGSVTTSRESQRTKRWAGAGDRDR